MRTITLTKETTKDILENLLKRSPNHYGNYEAAVREILERVKEEGDSALLNIQKSLTKLKSQQKLSGLRKKK